eukprot:XP_014786579.1 PREDICTED: uncharacterized protein LOC106880922 [Octopus bimaculoides]
MKGTYIFFKAIGPYGFNALLKKPHSSKFSLVIVETTDVSTLKQLVLVSRYYDVEIQKTVDDFLTLIAIHDCSATGIYNCLLSFLNDHAIPLENLIGFACDNADVMMRSKGGVQHLLKQNRPDLFLQACVCYSLHLCSSNTCNELPNSFEELTRSIYAHFSYSPKYINEFKDMQKIA